MALQILRAGRTRRAKTISGAVRCTPGKTGVADFPRIQFSVAAEIGTCAFPTIIALTLVTRRARDAGILETERAAAFRIMGALLVLFEETVRRAAFAPITRFAGIEPPVAAELHACSVDAFRSLSALQIIGATRLRRAADTDAIRHVLTTVTEHGTVLRAAFAALIALTPVRLFPAAALDADPLSGLLAVRPGELLAVLFPAAAALVSYTDVLLRACDADAVFRR